MLSCAVLSCAVLSCSKPLATNASFVGLGSHYLSRGSLIAARVHCFENFLIHRPGKLLLLTNERLLGILVRRDLFLVGDLLRDDLHFMFVERLLLVSEDPRAAFARMTV